MRVHHAATATLLLCLVLSGCSDGGDDPGEGRSGSPTATTEGSSTEPTDPTEAPAASGPVIDGESFTVHVPEGWTFNKDFSTEFVDQYANPDATVDERLYVGELAGEARPLADVAADNFTRFASTDTQRRKVPGAEIAGEPAYHFTATGSYGTFVEEFGVVRGGQQVTFNITLMGSEAERRAVVDSIIASWEWK